MVDIITRISTAQEYAMRVRPKEGGFPYLAESLRQTGVQQYLFDVPSATSVLITEDETVLQPGRALHTQPTIIPPFDLAAVVAAIRIDQEGRSTFPEFVEATLRAGVIRYSVDLNARTCTYVGVRGEAYVEEYAAVELPQSS